MDPWWNPAVEQQAIDRTHRIGQTKNIFAYRMICKDSIEDKILQLQERKRALAKDIISDDTGFVKSLTREDVEYLFSWFLTVYHKAAPPFTSIFADFKSIYEKTVQYAIGIHLFS